MHHAKLPASRCSSAGHILFNVLRSAIWLSLARLSTSCSHDVLLLNQATYADLPLTWTQVAATAFGFRHVECGPLVRSSYHAEEQAGMAAHRGDYPVHATGR